MSIADNRTRWLALIVLCLGDLDDRLLRRDHRGRRAPVDPRGPRLLGGVARMDRERQSVDLRGFLLLEAASAIVGHRRMFLAGIALFTLADHWLRPRRHAGAPPTARAVQGVGGAIVSAVALSLIITLFTERPSRLRRWASASRCLGSIGVLLGGVLTEHARLALDFLVNVPVGIAVFALTLFLGLLPAGGGMAFGRLDVAGAVTVTAASMVAVYAIRERERGRYGAPRAACSRSRVCSRMSPPDRVAGAARPAPPLPAAERGFSANVVGVLWARQCSRGSSCRRSTCSTCSATPRSQVGLAFLPGSSNLIMGASLARPVREARDADSGSAVRWRGTRDGGGRALLFVQAPADGRSPSTCCPA